MELTTWIDKTGRAEASMHAAAGKSPQMAILGDRQQLLFHHGCIKRENRSQCRYLAVVLSTTKQHTYAQIFPELGRLNANLHGRRYVAMRGWKFLTLSLLLPAALLLQTASANSAKLWVKRKFEFEKILRMGSVISVDDLGEGRNQPKKVRLQLEDETAAAIWKPIERGRHEWAWECYQAEVVAYRLDKLLGLDMVPPTVERSIRGQKGSLQLWIDGAKLYSEVQEDPPDPVKWERELSRMKLFDNLICNPDRNARNFMVDSDWNIILIDHSQCFLSREDLRQEPGMLPVLFDRKVVNQLRKLTLERLQVRFGYFLMDREIQSMMSRRTALLAHIDKLIAEKGEKAVLF
jgi:hypothetical protein